MIAGGENQDFFPFGVCPGRGRNLDAELFEDGLNPLESLHYFVLLVHGIYSVES